MSNIFFFIEITSIPNAFIFPWQLYFLRDHLYEAELKIQAGLGRYTWQSLNIKEYCQRCQTVYKLIKIKKKKKIFLF